ncbi:hypothetical protein AB0919_14645 [Streptomyces sp. NPDC046994]|uniref:hypothetical protein n=1 Tax=Streptomyces sp. NPDC046994 TaxID=3155735 RepID=UPI003456C284
MCDRIRYAGSTVQVVELTDTIHDKLAERHLVPAEHVVDSGCASRTHVEQAQRVHGITLLGPSPTTAPSEAAPGFDKAAFGVRGPSTSR